VDNTKFVVNRSPSVLESISETINEQFIDLIIIGTHGATGFRKIFLGSNAASIIEQSYCPVLAIPNKYKFNGIKTIAYACSDLDNLQNELKKIIPMAQKIEASIQIFHIVSGKKAIISYENFNAEVFMKSLLSHFKFNNMSLDLIDSKENSLSISINNFIKHNKPDLFAMLTNKRSFFEKIFTTSQTKEMSYQLSIPLLAVKPEVN
jgi:Universal stress protein family